MNNLELYYILKNEKIYYLELDSHEPINEILKEYLKDPEIKIFRNCSNCGLFDEVTTEELNDEK